MKSKQRAFTLIELLVAIGLLGVVIVFAGSIFRLATDAYRKAGAQAEIMRKVRTIKHQLDEDFRGLVTESGFIFIGWVEDANTRYDRITFFSHGHFESFEENPNISSTARISYMLARRDQVARGLPATERVLARTAHPLVVGKAKRKAWLADMDLLSAGAWYQRYNDPKWQYDPNTLDEWKNRARAITGAAINGIMDIDIISGSFPGVYGVDVNDADPNALRSALPRILCQGISSFQIEGFYWADPNDPNAWVWGPDAETDLIEPQPKEVEKAGFLLSSVSGGVIALEPPLNENYRLGSFDTTPGLGRALRFTFTVHDRLGIVEPQEFQYTVLLPNSQDFLETLSRAQR